MCNFRERKKMKPDISAVVINRNGHVVFTVYGSFDRENTPHVFEGITPLFKEASKGVTMDLEGVTKIDNSGIGAIVECVRMASDAGIEFHVVGIANNI